MATRLLGIVSARLADAPCMFATPSFTTPRWSHLTTEIDPEHFIMSESEAEFEPLTLNISREALQQNQILRVIKKNLVKECLEMFAEIAEKKDDYNKFYEQFGKCIKLGVYEDSTTRLSLARPSSNSFTLPGCGDF